MLRLIRTSTLACVILLLSVATAGAQGSLSLRIRVLESGAGSPMPGATVILWGMGKKLGSTTSQEGTAHFTSLSKGDYRFQVRYIGFSRRDGRVHLASDTTVVVTLVPYERELEGVVVTARESRGMTSSSIIGKEAMVHLQPSSFGDLLELLPGGLSKDPQLLSPNRIRIREAEIPMIGNFVGLPKVDQSNYNTSSQGTTFLIDGIPIPTDANRQILKGAHELKHRSRQFVNAGVDMRTISTDDIAEVEIIRGIPSVQYADLTSGLVRIKRKHALGQLEGRFKADLASRLLHLAKGVNLLDSTLNLTATAGYLGAHADPRNHRQSYQRVTGSLRSTYHRRLPSGNLTWSVSADYTGSIDDEKIDMDLDVMPVDTYRSSYHSTTLSQTLTYDAYEKGWLSDLDFSAAVTYSRDQLHVVKDILISKLIPYVTAREEGEYIAKYYDHQYIAEHIVDGQPLYLYSKLKGESKAKLGSTRHNILWGGSWDLSKNLGKGALYDLDHPVFYEASTRPRPFNDVPAKNTLSLFLEDSMEIPIAGHLLSIEGGVVGNALLGLPSAYAMRGHVYPDIRVNMRWDIKPVPVRGKDLKIQLLAGAGTLSMFPTMLQLYPDKEYHDFVQLNYYHVNQDYCIASVRTYVETPDNTGLLPAKNIKYELRADAEYGYYSGSITLFQERMSSGFRHDPQLLIPYFKVYSVEGLDHAHLTKRPDLATLPYTERKLHRLISHTSNGSETLKQGVEWTLHTPRYPSWFTRVTFSGAWFRTIYKNSQPQYMRPTNVLLLGKELEYIGIYADNEKLERQSLNTDLRLDSYVPMLGLGVSLSMQANWFSSSQMSPISVYPDQYVDLSGEVHPYTEADKTHIQRNWLKRNSHPSLYKKYSIPFMMAVNLKTTKYLFDRRMRVALFVNKIFDYSPDFEMNGFTIRRNQYPYFGMELNVSL